MLQSGTILGNRYEIIQLVGSGGMADVYKAKCHRLNRLVAIKVLKEEFGKDADFVKRFHVEAQAAAGLMHPNIVNIYDVGEEAGLHYIVMELAEGMTLQSYIRKKGRLASEEAVTISIQIAQGIEAAHNNNTVHRDIKPQNIIVTNEGRIKVTDFGIARASSVNTITMATIGSVHYFSPEQARGGYVDTRSDIYSLGITMYEMVTGHVPFDGENPVTVALKHLQEEVIPPSQIVPEIPKSLENIILRAVNKKVELRYATVTEMIADLKKVFQQTDGNYVLSGAEGQEATGSPTIIMSGADVAKIKKLTGKNNSYIKRATKIEEEETEPEQTFFQEQDEMNPKLEKLILGLTILVGVIFAIIFMTFIVKTVGKNVDRKEAATTEATEVTEMTEYTGEDDEYTDKTLIPMPKVVGLTQKDAESMLTDRGLVPVVQTEVSNDVKKGYVIRQSIPYGYDVEEGQNITLIVSSGREQVEVPQVTGDKESTAKKKLTEQHFQVKTKEAFSDTVKEGSVISQSPKGGKKADYGSRVTLTISKGSKGIAVPTLVGKSFSEAESLLHEYGLAPGTITEEHSDRYAKGIVISQNPAKGTRLKKGSAVNLVVSLGEEAKNCRYTGQVTVDCPFNDGVEEGSVSLVLSQSGKTKTIYNKNIKASEFPLRVNFDGYAEGKGSVTVYWDGNKTGSYEVVLEKVEE